MKDCCICPSLSSCTQNKRQRRTVTIRPEQQYNALQISRGRETTDHKQEYDRRADIEGTLSQGIRESLLKLPINGVSKQECLEKKCQNPLFSPTRLHRKSAHCNNHA